MKKINPDSMYKVKVDFTKSYTGTKNEIMRMRGKMINWYRKENRSGSLSSPYKRITVLNRV
jgi:hypothetical protein